MTDLITPKIDKLKSCLLVSPRTKEAVKTNSFLCQIEGGQKFPVSLMADPYVNNGVGYLIVNGAYLGAFIVEESLIKHD